MNIEKDIFQHIYLTLYAYWRLFIYFANSITSELHYIHADFKTYIFEYHAATLYRYICEVLNCADGSFITLLGTLYICSILLLAILPVLYLPNIWREMDKYLLDYNIKTI